MMQVIDWNYSAKYSNSAILDDSEEEEDFEEECGELEDFEAQDSELDMMN